MAYENTKKVLNEFGNLIIDVYKNKLAQENWQSGELYKTINLDKVTVNSNKMSITISLANYWKYIEYGIKAGKQKNRKKIPPPDKISNWITKKNIIPKPIKLKNGKTKIPTQKQLTYLICYSILKNGFKYGVKGKYYLELSIKEIKERFIKSIEESLKEDLIKEI